MGAPFAKKTVFLGHKIQPHMKETDSLFSHITTFIFDFDGVMTDGTVFCDFEGHPLRATNVKDGYALQLASKLGYHVAVISGAVCPSTIVRMNSLGVTDVFTGIPNKVLKLNEYMKDKGLKPETSRRSPDSACGRSRPSTFRCWSASPSRRRPRRCSRWTAARR